MAKLKSIEEIEAQQVAQLEARRRAEAAAAAKAREEALKQAPAEGASAAQEAAYHGLDDAGSTATEQKIVRVFALVGVLAAAAYVLNYWFNFV